VDETSFESEKTNQLSWFPNLKASKEKSGELAILVPQISTLRDVKKFLELGKVILYNGVLSEIDTDKKEILVYISGKEIAYKLENAPEEEWIIKNLGKEVKLV